MLAVPSLAFRFRGGALTFVPWHFIHHRPLQPVVRRLAQRFMKGAHVIFKSLLGGRLKLAALPR
jgi:hypothetical protein